MHFSCVSRLDEVSIRRSLDRLSFRFPLGEVCVKGIYFKQPRTFLIGVPERDIAWQFSTNSENNISTFIPNDAFRKIKDDLFEVFYVYSTNELYKKIGLFLNSVDEHHFLIATTDEVSELLSYSKTAQKDFDPDGDKSFFIGWRRNPIDQAVQEANLSKTDRLFGREISSLCRETNVSSRWANHATDKSLDFLNVELNVDYIKSL